MDENTGYDWLKGVHSLAKGTAMGAISIFAVPLATAHGIPPEAATVLSMAILNFARNGLKRLFPKVFSWL